MRSRQASLHGNIDSSPAIGADGTIYVGSRNNNLYAIKPDDTLKWAFTGMDAGLIDFESPVIGPDGTIYIGNEGSRRRRPAHGQMDHYRGYHV